MQERPADGERQRVQSVVKRFPAFQYFLAESPELSANGKLDLPDDLRIARFQDVDPALVDGGG